MSMFSGDLIHLKSLMETGMDIVRENEPPFMYLICLTDNMTAIIIMIIEIQDHLKLFPRPLAC
jgi:hypothetical protein